MSLSRRYEAQPLETLHIPEARLKLKTVVALTGLSESSIRRRVAAGDFPAPQKYGARCIRWISAEVLDWLSAAAKTTSHEERLRRDSIAAHRSNRSSEACTSRSLVHAQVRG
jgi:prophage regulatory protein